MSYALTPAFGQATMDMPTMTTGSSLPSWAPWAIGGVFVVLIGGAIYANYKISKTIAEREGAGGVLAYQAGLTGLGLLGEALRQPRRNAKRRKRRRSRR